VQTPTSAGQTISSHPFYMYNAEIDASIVVPDLICHGRMRSDCQKLKYSAQLITLARYYNSDYTVYSLRVLVFWISAGGYIVKYARDSSEPKYYIYLVHDEVSSRLRTHCAG
jgi:hypothetical protein